MIFSIKTSLIIAFLAIIPIAIKFWLKKLSVRTIRNRHVVITGGSKGIGLSIAKRCAQLGAHVTIISRNLEKLQVAVEEIKRYRCNDKQKIQCGSIDLSKSDEAVKTLFTKLENDVGSIYWLVNCAGGVMHGRMCEMFPDDPVHLMNIKYYAVYYPVRFVLDKMKNRRNDGIITITGSQAKELVMEIYGQGPHGECKLSSLGLAKIINMKSHSKISITLALEGITMNGHDELDGINESVGKHDVTIISDRANLVKLEEAASKIVRDSLGGKFISTSGLENWLFLNFLKICHFLRIAIIKSHKFYQKRNTAAKSNALKKMPTIHVSPPSPKKTTHTHKKTTEIDNLIKPTEYNKNMTLSNVDDNGQLLQKDVKSSSSITHSNEQMKSLESESKSDSPDLELEELQNIKPIESSLNAQKRPKTVNDKENDASLANKIAARFCRTDTFTLPNGICIKTKNPKTASVALSSFVSFESSSNDPEMETNSEEHSPHETVENATKQGEVISEKNVNWLIDLDSVPTKDSSEPSTNKSAPVSSVASSISMFNAGCTKPDISTSQNAFSFRMTVPKALSAKSQTDQTTNPLGVSEAGTAICSTIPSKQSRIGDGSGIIESSNSLFSDSITPIASVPSTYDPFDFTLSDDKVHKNILKASILTGNSVAPGVGEIGMEMFAKNKTDSQKPAFSFKTADNNNVGLNSLLKKTSTIDAGVVFSFNANGDSDPSKPFKFEAKSMDDLSNKPDIAGTTIKSHLPVRKSTNRRNK